MRYDFESGRNDEINEASDEIADSSYEQPSEADENFDDCTQDEASEADESYDSEAIEEADEDFDDCEKDMENSGENQDEISEDNEDENFDDCVKEEDIPEEKAEHTDESDKNNSEVTDSHSEVGEYTAEDAEEASEQAEEEKNKELAETEEDKEEEIYNESDENADVQEAQELEENSEYRNQILEDPGEYQKYAEVRQNEEQLTAERDQINEDIGQLNDECAEKFNRVSEMDPADDEYKEALQDYNNTKDARDAALNRLSETDSRIADLNIEAQNLKDEIDHSAREAINNSDNYLTAADELHSQFEELHYSDTSKTEDIRSVIGENDKLIDTMKEDKKSLDEALKLKKDEMMRYHSAHDSYGRSMEHDPYYKHLIDEYNSIQSRQSELDYNIGRLETNNQLLERDAEMIEARPTIRDKIKSVFSGLFPDENNTSAETVSIPIEDNAPSLEDSVINPADIEENMPDGSEDIDSSPEERFDKLRDRDINELSDAEKRELVSISVDNIISEYGDKLSAERIEKIKNSVSFVDSDEVLRDTGEDPDRILGYYNPVSDSIKINTSAEGNTNDIIATIDHECMHMLSQQVDEAGIPNGETGVKMEDLRYGNVGMNEGITEMYSIRNMKDINPDYVSNSYVTQVEIMGKYEQICGENTLRKAYIENDVSLLQKDFDSVMGNGQFKIFCDNMDKLHLASENQKLSEVYWRKADINAMLEKYSEGKRKKLI